MYIDDFNTKPTKIKVIEYLTDKISEEGFKETLESKFDCFINLRDKSELILFLCNSLKNVLND